MNKHIGIWNIARKLKLDHRFYEGLDTLLTKIESDNQQLILQNVSKSLIMLPEIEEKELSLLIDLQSDHTRWLTQNEWDRIQELTKKRFKNSNPYNVC